MSVIYWLTVQLVVSRVLIFFKEIYCTESIIIVYKDKLQNCSFNQFD